MFSTTEDKYVDYCTIDMIMINELTRVVTLDMHTALGRVDFSNYSVSRRHPSVVPPSS
jgi:hypothetical protein